MDDEDVTFGYGLKEVSDDVFSSSAEEKSREPGADSTARSLEQVLEVMDKSTEKSIRFNKEAEKSTLLWLFSQYLYYLAEWLISFINIGENLFVLFNLSSPYLPYQLFIAFIYFDLMERLFFMMGHRRPQLSHPARIIFQVIQLLVYTNFCNFSSSSIIFYVILFAFKANLVMQEYYHVVQEALEKFNDKVKNPRISDEEFDSRYLQAILIFALTIVAQVAGFVFVFADSTSFFATLTFEIIVTFYFWTTVSLGAYIQKKILYPVSFVTAHAETSGKMTAEKRIYDALLRIRNTYFEMYLAIAYNTMFVVLCFAFSVFDRTHGRFPGSDWPLWYSLTLLVLLLIGSVAYAVKSAGKAGAVVAAASSPFKSGGVIEWTKQSESQEWVAEDNLKF